MAKTKTAAIGKAATALTTALTGWVSSTIDTGNAEQVVLFFAYVYNSATAVNVLIEFSDDGGTTWYEDDKVSDGTVEQNLLSRTVTASVNFFVSVDVSAARYMRVKASRTGGAATDTLALKYSKGGRIA